MSVLYKSLRRLWRFPNRCFNSLLNFFELFDENKNLGFFKIYYLLSIFQIVENISYLKNFQNIIVDLLWKRQTGIQSDGDLKI